MTLNNFQRVNSHWSDEKLYQEGRRVMSAVTQHITFNEFLPRIIGWNYMNLYNLRVKTEGYTDDYDSTCNPGIFNEFSTAAFRFGHSLIRPMLTRMSPDWREMHSHIRLRDGFFNPDMLYEATMIDEVRCFEKTRKFHFVLCSSQALFLMDMQSFDALFHDAEKYLCFSPCATVGISFSLS